MRRQLLEVRPTQPQLLPNTTPHVIVNQIAVNAPGGSCHQGRTRVIG